MDYFALEHANRLTPYAWPPPPNLTGLEVRSQPYIECLESQISLLEQRLRGARADRISRSIRRTLDTYIQELQRVTGARRPEPRPLPFMVRYAIKLQQSVKDLETRIEDLRKQPEDITLHDTLEGLINELRKAKLARAQILPGVGIIVETPDAPANTVANDDYNLMTEPQGELDSPDIPGVQTSATTRDTFSDLFRGRPTRHVSASSPTIVAPQTHGEANHEAIEDLANTTPGPVSGKGLDEGGNRTITEGTSTDGSCNPNPTSDDELGPDTRHPIAAAPPGSPPNCDPTPDVGSQDVQMETDAAPIDDGDGGPSSSVAFGPNPPATTALRASTTMAPVSPDVDDAFDDDALNEELYSDKY